MEGMKGLAMISDDDIVDIVFSLLLRLEVRGDIPSGPIHNERPGGTYRIDVPALPVPSFYNYSCCFQVCWYTNKRVRGIANLFTPSSCRPQVLRYSICHSILLRAVLPREGKKLPTLLATGHKKRGLCDSV
jgi:hypothetical protein